MMNFETHITFDDVLLVPQYSDIKSRTEVTLASELSEGLELRVPIISAPMDTVCGRLMAERLAEFGGLGIIHRYNTIEKQAEMVAKASEGGLRNVGAAIGITGDYLDRAAALIEAGVTTLCLDVAHGDHVLMPSALTMLSMRSEIKRTLWLAISLHTQEPSLLHTLALIVSVSVSAEALSAPLAFRPDTECLLLPPLLIV